MRVMEIKYFEFYCKFYQLYEHFELKMILWTKYLDNSRTCTKQVKLIQKKQWKKFVADVWKIIFSLTFNSMESYHPEHLLVYYKFLKNLNIWRTFSTSGKGLFHLSSSDRDTSWNVWNRPSESFMVDMGISLNIMKLPSPKCYMTFWDMTIYTDTLNWSDITPIFELITELDFITDFDFITKFWRFP